MATPETRQQLLAAVAACDDKKGEDTRILSLDPADSGLADFFLITSASNDRQVLAIADEIELRLKKEFGLYPASVEGRRQAEWILLDYIDIVIHVFLAEKRAFYDIERLRKSARPLTPAELEAELKAALAEKTRAVRSSAAPKQPSAKTAQKIQEKVATRKSPASMAAKPNAKSEGVSAVTPKPILKKAAAKKAASKKAASKAAPKASLKPGKETKAKVAPAKKTALKAAKKKSTPVKAAVTKAGVVKATALAPSAGALNRASSVFGAKPPILKCEDPNQVATIDFGAKPPIVKCEDPDVALAASTHAVPVVSKKKPSKKSPKASVVRRPR